MDRSIEVIEYTDAMCSWAWGTEPKLRLLRWRFEPQLARWRVVMGHLVEDEHMPRRDREVEAPKLQQYWKVVCDETGMPRPDPLRRSTAGSRASGLMVKAAAHQGDEAVQAVLRRLREATFVHGDPPDTTDRALHAIRGAKGVDLAAVAAAMDQTANAAAYQADLDETRRPNEHVLRLEGDRPGIGRAREARDGRMRFVFPTLVFRSGEDQRTVPGWMPYEAYEDAVVELGAERDERARSRPSVAEAFERWPSLADAELAFLCGERSTAPAEAIHHRRPGGEMILTAAEAAALGEAAAPLDQGS